MGSVNQEVDFLDDPDGGLRLLVLHGPYFVILNCDSGSRPGSAQWRVIGENRESAQ
jgi:hypothetical protein